MGAAPPDLQHHQAGAEEEPPGRAGRAQVLRLQGDGQQPEVHELHLRRYGRDHSHHNNLSTHDTEKSDRRPLGVILTSKDLNAITTDPDGWSFG